MPRSSNSTAALRDASRPVGAAWWIPVAALAGTASAWVGSYVDRLTRGMTNVDDYLYALQTLDIRDAGILHFWRAWLAHPTNSPLLPTLAAPLSLLDPSPTTLVWAQLPLILALVWACASLAMRCGSSRAAAWFAGATVATTVGVLKPAVILNFGLAASLFTVTALAAYFASGRFTRLWPTLAFGASCGLLLLSRVLAPVYLLALLIPIGIDLAVAFRAARKRRRDGVGASRHGVGASRQGVAPSRRGGVPSGKYVALGAGLAALISVPWWLLCGTQVVGYLTGAGLSEQSFFTKRANFFERIEMRVFHTAYESGTLVVAATAVGILCAVLGLVRRAPCPRRLDSPLPKGPGAAEETPPRTALFVSATAAVLLFAVLLTSTNLGTGFAMPALAVSGTVAAADGWDAVITVTRRPLPRIRISALLAGACCALTVLASAFQVVPIPAPTVAGTPFWRTGLQTNSQFRAALGCGCEVHSERLNEEIERAIPERKVMLFRSDVVVNPQSLTFEAREDGAALNARADNDVTSIGNAHDAAVLTGTSRSPYTTANPQAVRDALTKGGYQLVRRWEYSPENSVELWRRTPPSER